jgi:hypothetical protein
MAEWEMWDMEYWRNKQEVDLHEATEKETL